MRAGVSLDTSIENILEEQTLPVREKERLRRILESCPEKDFISCFLASALKTGGPILEPLALIHKNLLIQQKMALKAKSASSQCRAQAEVLTWLPWALLFAIGCMDQEWLSSALSKSLSWILWSIAILLCGFGKKWLLHQVSIATQPTNDSDLLMEIYLPDLILRIISIVSTGNDPQSAFEQSVAAMENRPLNAILSRASQKTCPPEINQLRAIIYSDYGAPIRIELLQMLEDLHLLQESRIEERVQKLPVYCLAPLFSCFFPACLLVLLSLIIPMLKDFS